MTVVYRGPNSALRGKKGLIVDTYPEGRQLRVALLLPDGTFHECPLRELRAVLPQSVSSRIAKA